MSRITRKDLDHLVARLNQAAGTPAEPYTNDKANVGCFFIAGAYGGFQLQQIDNVSGGVRSITNGYLPKREVFNLTQAFFNGLISRKE